LQVRILRAALRDTPKAVALIPQAGAADAAERPARAVGDRRAARVAGLVLLLVGLLHGFGIYLACGGLAEMLSPWPLALHDHPLQFHSSTIAPRLFGASGTNAGYDPSFMAGYAKSVVFPQSAQLFDMVAILSGGVAPAQAYKLTVFLAVAALPWLIAWAAWLWGLGPWAVTTSAGLFVLYAWTDGAGGDFPLNYAYFGMVPYLLAVPLGLVALAAYTRWLERGGWGGWLGVAILAAVLWTVHITAPMTAVPAGLAAYFAASARVPRPGWSRHVGTWMLVPTTLLANAWWWWPGLSLAGTKGESGFAFAHPEPVARRLAELFWSQPPIQPLLLGLLVPGLILVGRRSRAAAWALGGYAAAGFAWGYLAGAARWLDFLQPGRQTYAWQAAATVAGGAALVELAHRLRPAGWSVRLGLLLALALLGVRIFGTEVVLRLPKRLGDAHRPPFLSSRPPERLRWVVERVREHMQPGERLLYEESGIDLEGIPDPYAGGRFSGLLPYLTGVEVLGGPYLHAALDTNFTQFGEGRLFGRLDWDEGFFRRHAAIYRPQAILCWSPRAVAFCSAHPELIEILAVDDRRVTVLDYATRRAGSTPSRLVFARVKGFDGPAVRGLAHVVAEPGRLRIESARADELDGLVVLGYHSLPRLRGRPPVRIEPIRLGNDPVPFIGFRPPAGPFALELDFGLIR
jgi:hypothetical protein